MGPKSAAALALCGRLFRIATDKKWAAEALVYNQLAQEWPKLDDMASNFHVDLRQPPQPEQASLFGT